MSNDSVWTPVETGIAHEGPCGMQDGPVEPDAPAAVWWIEFGEVLGVEIQGGKGFGMIRLPDNLRLCQRVPAPPGGVPQDLVELAEQCWDEMPTVSSNQDIAIIAKYLAMVATPAQPQPPAPMPDWSQAPEWANFWTMDRDGRATWWETEPILRDEYTWWLYNWAERGKSERNIPKPPEIDWRQTLQRRPAPLPPVDKFDAMDEAFGRILSSPRFEGASSRQSLGHDEPYA